MLAIARVADDGNQPVAAGSDPDIDAFERGVAVIMAGLAKNANMLDNSVVILQSAAAAQVQCPWKFLFHRNSLLIEYPLFSAKG